MYKYRVVYYVDQNMERPVEAFLDKHPRVKVKVLRTLMNIEEYGLSMAIPHIKRLTGTPFWEIRILGKENARIFYVTQTDKTIMLLHGFIKKSQKTDSRDIAIAYKRYKEVIDNIS